MTSCWCPERIGSPGAGALRECRQGHDAKAVIRAPMKRPHNGPCAKLLTPPAMTWQHVTYAVAIHLAPDSPLSVLIGR